MKLHRHLGATLLALALLMSPARATEQASYVTPTAGPLSMASFTATYLNPALRALAACHNGSSAPANGPSGAPLAYQCWVDTTANPSLYKIYDGASWIVLGSINTSTHIWLPRLTGGVSGGVPYFSATDIMGTSALLAQNGFVIGGGAGAAPATIAACTDDQIAFGRTGSSPLCRTVSGDVTFAGGVSAVGSARITSAMLRNSGALSVIGRSANSSGVPADISATAASDAVLRESGSVVGFGTIATNGIAANAVTDAKLRQGGALTVIGRSANSTGNVADIQASAASDAVLRESGSVVGFGTIATNGIAANAVTNAKLAAMAANTVKANATGGSAVPTDVGPASARTSSLLNIDQMTTHGDSIYTILATDRKVVTSAAFTASRAWTLPAANAVNAGQELIVADLAGGVTASNTLVITRAGSDTINGGTTATISAANGAYLLVSDGTSKWTAQSMGAASGGGVTSVTCGAGLSGGTITTSGTCAVSGSTVLLNTLTASNSATLSDTTNLTATYPEYEIIFENLVPATNNVTLEFQVHSGGSFQSTSYSGVNVITGSVAVITNPTTFIQLSQTTSLVNTLAGFSGTLRIIAPSGTSAPKHIFGNGTHNNGSFYLTSQFSGAWTGGNGAVDGFQVLMSSGNITSGTVKVYGRL